jgi:hypothetical protein
MRRLAPAQRNLSAAYTGGPDKKSVQHIIHNFPHIFIVSYMKPLANKKQVAPRGKLGYNTL